MDKVLVLGGGKVGKSVAEILLACGRGAYSVTLADRDEANLKIAAEVMGQLKSRVPHAVEFRTIKLDASDQSAVRAAMAQKLENLSKKGKTEEEDINN